MIKQITEVITQPQNFIAYICDACVEQNVSEPKKWTRGKGGDRIDTCDLCRRQFCKEHGTYYADHYVTDHDDFVCNDCHEKTKTLREAIEKCRNLIEIYEKEIEEICKQK